MLGSLTAHVDRVISALYSQVLGHCVVDRAPIVESGSLAKSSALWPQALLLATVGVRSACSVLQANVFFPETGLFAHGETRMALRGHLKVDVICQGTRTVTAHHVDLVVAAYELFH